MVKKDLERTKEELVAELEAMRQRVAALEARTISEEATEEKLRRLNMVLRAIRNINQLIARGADRAQLLRGVCYNLVKNRGCYSTWVALLDGAGKLVASSQAGLGRDFARLKRMLQRGELPPCATKALEATGAVVIEAAKGVCAACPLGGKGDKYGDSTRMSVRLAYGGKVYGVMTVATLSKLAGDREEKGLLEEVAADIAFALHSLEAEEARSKAEEELRRSEERYRTLVDNLVEGVVVVQDNKVVFVNRTSLRRSGYSLEDLQQMSLWDIFHPEDVDKAKRRLERWLKGERQPRYYPLRVLTKDGNIKWMLFNLANITWDGKPAWLVLIEDVTEQKRLEDMLVESEQRYRTMLDEMDEAYFEVDLRGNLVFFSDALARQLGYTPEELMGMNYRKYVPEEDWENIFQSFNQVYRTGEPLRWLHAVQVTKDGRRIDVEYNVLPRRNEKGEVIGFRGVTRDISERRRMEEALRKSEERFRTVLDEMEDSYFELDIAGNCTFVNDALCRTIGYSSKEEILGKNYRTLVAQEDWGRIFRVFNEVYRTGRPQKGVIFKVVRKDGSVSIGELAAMPLRDEKGEVIGFRGVGRDVSERVRAEEDRRELERRAHLAARLASVGEMASGIAHEINNPLTGVIGYAQLLLARRDIPEDMKAALEVINESAQRVATILRRLLTFARQYKPERRLVNINEVVQAALRLRAYHLETSNIKVTTQLAPNLPATIADPGQLQQVFLNIIINAEAAMKRVSRQGRLVVKTEALDSTIRISFKDNGPGIAPEHLERIFEPFFTTSEVGEGAGLGLSVCHGIITEHQGKIWAESQPGRGATFFIELPVEAGLVEKKAAPAEAPGQLRRARILVVDDEAVVREFVVQVLGMEGCDVDTAGSAKEALEKVRARHYELMLLDIKMPGTSGIELYRQLRRLAPALTKRTLFITGDVMGEGTREFLTRSGAPYLVKPFDASKLRAEVARVLSRD